MAQNKRKVKELFNIRDVLHWALGLLMGVSVSIIATILIKGRECLA